MNEQQRKAAFEQVFLSHKWGDSVNSGKDYKRPYNKTEKKRGESEKSVDRQ